MTDPSIRHLALPYGDIAYLEQGAPDAPLVVLQHGFPDFPKTFLPVMSLLSAAGHRCVAPFLRGYVPSTLHGPFHAGRMGEGLAAVVRALSPGRPALLVGHDWGAVATYAAVTRAPELFRRAVTLAIPHTAAFQYNLQKSRKQQRQSAYMGFFMLPFLPDRVVPLNDFAFVDALWRRWSPGYRPDAAYMRELKACLRASLPAPLGHYRALRSTLVGRPPPARKITVPLLHLHGEDDGCVDFATSRGEERYFAGEFRSECLPGLGHFLHLEAPERVAERILQFAAS